MPAKTATDVVKAELNKNPDPSPDEIKEIAEKAQKETGKGSKALVYKWIRRMPQQPKQAVEPSEPVFTVEEEPEEEIIEEPEKEEAFEVPSFDEEPKAEPEEGEEPEAEITIDEMGEKEQRLKEISGRAISRIFDVAIIDIMDLTKVGLSKQEAEDTEFLMLILIAKYLKVEAEQYMLEFTSGLHFGSIAFKVFVKWLKKRSEEKEKEKPAKTPEPEPKPEPEKESSSEEKVALCSACGKQPVAPNSTQGLCVSCQKKAENRFMKKFRR